ncbi:MAG: putative RNA methylase [Methanophagales archaeon]|nr:putative RNA methylase [Methanophagales archaeon]
MLLEQLEDIPAPNVHIEQYTTPASLAAELIFFAFLNGDIAEKTVFDFGCGNGILGIAAKMLGAKRVVCVDIDENALEIARRNAQKLGVEVELVHSDVRDFNEKGRYCRDESAFWRSNCEQACGQSFRGACFRCRKCRLFHS